MFCITGSPRVGYCSSPCTDGFGWKRVAFRICHPWRVTRAPLGSRLCHLFATWQSPYDSAILSLTPLYREWLLSELNTETSRKHKQTIWHTLWNDGSLDSIVVGFKECCISNNMNSQWKIMKNIHLFVIECWQWVVNWVMMCILGYSSYSNVLTVMFI